MTTEVREGRGLGGGSEGSYSHQRKTPQNPADRPPQVGQRGCLAGRESEILGGNHGGGIVTFDIGPALAFEGLWLAEAAGEGRQGVVDEGISE